MKIQSTVKNIITSNKYIYIIFACSIFGYWKSSLGGKLRNPKNYNSIT